MGRASNLDTFCQAARRAHPDLPLEGFKAHLERIADDPPPADRAGELFLAFTAGAGEPSAVQRVRQQFRPDVDRALGKAASTGVSIDELRQRVWVKLLSGAPPHIHRYTGRGTLQGWIRVVVSRMVVDLLRSHGARREVAFAPALLTELGRVEPDPQLEMLKQQHHDDVAASMEFAFGELSDKERRLLRAQLIERLSTDGLGALYGVHRTTAARWAEQARARLVQLTHEELQRRVGAGEATVRSLVELVRSGLDLSVARLLASSG